MASSGLIRPTDRGLYCAAGDFYIDPWRPVPRAVVTHAHSDHATAGCEAYLTAASGVAILHERVGKGATIEGAAFGETRTLNGVEVSLHPAGHILGSAQVRVTHRGETWVVSGDYKTTPDAACETFTPVPCDHFITECTFGLPLYRWPDPDTVFADIAAWWRRNQENGLVSVLFSYPLGKSQRLLTGLADYADLGPIAVHGSVARFLPHYEAADIRLAPTEHLTADTAKALRAARGLLVAPASAQNTGYLRKLGKVSPAFASGWMRVRGARRRRALDRGFVLSDHADWEGLLAAVEATGATTIGATHGATDAFVRYLKEVRRLEAYTIPTRYTGETVEEGRYDPEDATTADAGKQHAGEDVSTS